MPKGEGTRGSALSPLLMNIDDIASDMRTHVKGSHPNRVQRSTARRPVQGFGDLCVQKLDERKRVGSHACRLIIRFPHLALSYRRIDRLREGWTCSL